MEITINYSTTRRELFNWYWRIWRSYLWKIHLGIGIIILLITVLIEQELNIWDYKIFLLGILIFAIIILIFILSPQIMYKSQNRELKVNEFGISTSIGNEGGQVKWEEILKIEDNTDQIVIIGKSLNAFIIPRYAFDTDEKRNRFIIAIRNWQRENNIT